MTALGAEATIRTGNTVVHGRVTRADCDHDTHRVLYEVTAAEVTVELELPLPDDLPTGEGWDW